MQILVLSLNRVLESMHKQQFPTSCNSVPYSFEEINMLFLKEDIVFEDPAPEE